MLAVAIVVAAALLAGTLAFGVVVYARTSRCEELSRHYAAALSVPIATHEEYIYALQLNGDRNASIRAAEQAYQAGCGQ